MTGVWGTRINQLTVLENGQRSGTRNEDDGGVTVADGAIDYASGGEESLEGEKNLEGLV